ncbi:MAG: hypothetical protein ACREOH_03040 [Candidatus Entotheonellia bacterium]
MARKQQSVVALTSAERQQLLALLKKGSAKARTLRRANILLGGDEGRPDDLIVDTVHVSIQTVRNVRKRFAIAGLEEPTDLRPTAPRMVDWRECSGAVRVCQRISDAMH